jgi:hypothetical protein
MTVEALRLIVVSVGQTQYSGARTSKSHRQGRFRSCFPVASLAVKVLAAIILHVLIVLTMYPLLVALIAISGFKVRLIEIMRNCMALEAG